MSRHLSAGRPNDSSSGPFSDAKPQSGFFALLGGAAGATTSAVVSALLLLVNGSITLVMLGVLTDANPEWSQRKGVVQFALFTVPLVMLVVQWMIWDAVRGLFSRPPSDDEDQWNSI